MCELWEKVPVNYSDYRCHAIGLYTGMPGHLDIFMYEKDGCPCAQVWKKKSGKERRIRGSSWRDSGVELMEYVGNIEITFPDLPIGGGDFGSRY